MEMITENILTLNLSMRLRRLLWDLVSLPRQSTLHDVVPRRRGARLRLYL